MAFSPDGVRIVSGGDGGTVRIWDAETGHQVGAPLTRLSTRIERVAFSPDQRRIVFGDEEGTIRLWDAETRRQIGAPLAGHEGPINAVAFSPDGRRIVSGGEDHTLRLWDAETGREIGAPLREPEDRINALAFSPDGQYIISGGDYFGIVRLWDVTRLTQAWHVMAREACLTMLGPSGRTFSRAEIDADPLLFSEWNDPTRDVCAGFPGVPPLPRQGTRP